MTACGTSTSTKKPIESSQLEPIAETTPVSQVMTEVTPSPIPIKVVDKIKPIKPVVKSAKVPEANPTAAESTKSTQTVKPVTNTTIAPEKPVNITELVADISGNIGCSKVNKNYKIKVATIAIAKHNPQSLQGLSKSQIKQAVKQSIAEYPERADGLVAEYRSSNCAIAKNPTVATTSVTVDNSNRVPSQSGSCKQLRAQGIKNISVAANPWAGRLDRDNDGVACESK